MALTNDELSRLRDEAIGQLRAGNFAVAVLAYERLLAKSPGDADSLGLLALALHRSGRSEAARRKWLASLALPSEPQIHLRNLNNFIAAAIEAGLVPDAETAKLITVPDWPTSRIPTRAEKDMIISAGRGLVKIGQPAQAVRLVDGTAQLAGDDLSMARNFAEILMDAGQPEQAHRLLTGLAETLGNGGEVTLARAATAYRAGLDDEAVRLTNAAVATLPTHMTAAQPDQKFLIGVITPAPQVVTSIMTAQFFHFSANSPANLAWKSNNLYRFWSVFAEAPDADTAVARLPRPALILNNWVNPEGLSTPGKLDLVAGFADRLPAPILNHPRKAALATRQRNAERLAGIPGLVVPRVVRFRNEPAQRRHLVRTIGETVGFPVIIRDPFRQMGKEAAKVDSSEQLAAHLATIDSKQLYAIQFIDNPLGGGLFRKIRAVVFGDEVILSHVHFSERWNVHRERDATRTADFAVPAAEAAFAQSILFRPEETLGRTGIAALHAVRERIPLEFYGIDFDILPDGQLVFFEANAAMTISMIGRSSKNLETIRARMRDAFHRLLEQTMRQPAAGLHSHS
jgi:tetratricopeptide (TPR) repeat protein